MAFDSFKNIRFTTRTASAGTTHKEIYKKAPAIVREGKNARKNGGFFDYDFILREIDPIEGKTDKNRVHIEQDDTSKEVGIYLDREIFLSMSISFIETLPSSVATTISKSFDAQFGNATRGMPSGELVGYLQAPFASGSIGTGDSIISPCTASFSFLHPGIADPTTGKCNDLTIINSSTNCLYSTFKFDGPRDFLNTGQTAATNHLVSLGQSYLTRSFDKFDFHLVQSSFVPRTKIEFRPHNGSDIAFALSSSFSSSADRGIVSGAPFLDKDRGGMIETFYNGLNNNSGSYFTSIVKGFITGEGEFGSGDTSELPEAFFPLKQIIYFPSTSRVRSGSFIFASESQGTSPVFIPGNFNESNNTYSNGAIKTTIFYAGTGSAATDGPSGSFINFEKIGENPNVPASGSHLFLDANLSIPAIAGFYRPVHPDTGSRSGSFRFPSDGSDKQRILHAFIGGVTSSNLYNNAAATGIQEELIPRFCSQSLHDTN
jgi:hypothetical protein